MDNLPKVLVVNRKSVVPGAGISRSLEERVVEPLVFLKQRRLADYDLESDENWRSIQLASYTHLAINRPHSLDSLHMLQRAHAEKIPIIIDLDDLPIYFPADDVAYFSDEKKKFFFECLSLADLIVGSTPRIKKWAEEKFPLIQSVHVPTGLDFDRIDRLTPVPQKVISKGVTFTNAGSLKLGEFGSRWLRLMENVLLKTGWTLEVYADGISYLPPTLPFHYLGQLSWFDHKTALNGAFPLSVTPLASYEETTHLEYSQYKTPIKYLIYGGLGIPGIYSDCPIYSDEVTSYETGMVVKNTVEDWTETLTRLISDEALRAKITAAAKADVRRRFGINTAGKNWRSLLFQL